MKIKELYYFINGIITESANIKIVTEDVYCMQLINNLLQF